jgi:hypothetical protein
VKLKEKQLEWFDTYHCRHYWITNRLLAGESIHLIASAAGTSTREIESTYSHVIEEVVSRKFNERRVVSNKDGSYDVEVKPKPVKPSTVSTVKSSKRR